MPSNEELYPYTPPDSNDDNLDGIRALFREPINALPVFPIEVWLQLLLSYSPQQLASFSTVCVAAQILAVDEQLWRAFLLPTVNIKTPQTARSIFISQPELRKFKYLACDKKGQAFQRYLSERKTLLTAKLKLLNAEFETNISYSLDWMNKIPQYQLDPGFAKILLNKCLSSFETTEISENSDENPQANFKLFERENGRFFLHLISTVNNPSIIDNPVLMEIFSTNIATHGFSKVIPLFQEFPDYVNEEFFQYCDVIKKTRQKHGTKGAYTFMAALMQPDAKLLFNHPTFMSHLTSTLDIHGFEDAFQLIDALASPSGEFWLSHPTFMKIIWQNIKKCGFKGVGFLIRALNSPAAQVLRENPFFMAQLEMAIAKHGFKYVSQFIAALAKPEAHLLRNNPSAMEKLWNIIFDHGFEHTEVFIRFLTTQSVENIESILSLPLLIKSGFRPYIDLVFEAEQLKPVFTTTVNQMGLNPSDFALMQANASSAFMFNKAIARHGFENSSYFVMSLLLRSKDLLNDESSLFHMLNTAVSRGFAAGIAELNKQYPLPPQLLLGKHHAAFFAHAAQTDLPVTHQPSTDDIEKLIGKLKTGENVADSSESLLPPSATPAANAESHVTVSPERPTRRQ